MTILIFSRPGILPHDRSSHRPRSDHSRIITCFGIDRICLSWMFDRWVLPMIRTITIAAAIALLIYFLSNDLIFNIALRALEQIGL